MEKITYISKIYRVKTAMEETKDMEKAAADYVAGN